MMRRWTASASLAFAIAALLGIACGAFPTTVQSIVIDGNSEIRTRDILEVVAFDEGDEILQEDVKAASQAIFNLGWFSEVVPEIDDAGGIVTFHVVEYPVVEAIEVDGNDTMRTVELFGIPLFKMHIMTDRRVRTILRNNDIRKGDVLNRTGLENAISEIRQKYSDQGYLLISFGSVEMSPILRIEIAEAKVVANLVEGLETVPVSVAEAMIDLPLGEPLLQKDISPVIQRLQSSIYFSGYTVVPQTGGASDEVYLVWTLDERQILASPIEVTSIEVEGVTRYASNEIVAKLPELDGSTMDNYGLLTALEAVHDLYYRDGYTMVDFEVTEIEGGVLHVAVKEGVISSITYSGNTRTKDYVLERNLDMSVGDVFRQADYAAARQALSSLGYFASVNLLPEWTDEGVAVSLAVTEETRLGGVNGSIAVDPQTGAIVGEISLSQRNIAGTGQDVSLSYSRGMDEVDSEDNDVTTTSTWDLGYSTVAYFPGFDRVGLDFYQTLTEADSEADSDETQYYVTLGATLSFAYPIADYVSATLSYKHEKERLETEALWEPIDAVILSVAHDDRNDYYFSTGGGRRSATLEKAGGFAAGKEYTKLDLSWSHFARVDNQLFGAGMDQVFATRMKIGWGNVGLPDTETYVLGGASTVRGGDGIDVERMLVGNAEYRIEVTDGLILSAFADAGFDLDSVTLADGVSSVGLEMGFNVAGIYVRVDLAWMIGEDMSWAPRFDFGFGPMF